VQQVADTNIQLGWDT